MPDPLDALHLRLLMAADAPTEEQFRKVVPDALSLLEVTDEELARAFDMSRPSADRYRRGLTAPHPAMRKLVIRWLLQRAERKGCEL